jgi:hypothetical protein
MIMPIQGVAFNCVYIPKPTLCILVLSDSFGFSMEQASGKRVLLMDIG